MTVHKYSHDILVWWNYNEYKFLMQQEIAMKIITNVYTHTCPYFAEYKISSTYVRFE